MLVVGLFAVSFQKLRAGRLDRNVGNFDHRQLLLQVPAMDGKNPECHKPQSLKPLTLHPKPPPYVSCTHKAS